MKSFNRREALQCAIQAASAAGTLMRRNLSSAKKIQSEVQFDIKLDLDVRCQRKIEQILHKSYPAIGTLGEEGSRGDLNATYRWVVDPIDGTVNYAYGIPHACVSIALQKSDSSASEGYRSEIGVVLDPFQNEVWTAIRGQAARLNGKVIRVSHRSRLKEVVLSMGFAKSKATLDHSLPYFQQLIYRVRKMRIMGSAALALTYVATGRLDAFIETGIRLWDVAAGGLIVECAGGEFWVQSVKSQQLTYRMIASNGRLRRALTCVGGVKF